ncbi:MAG: carbon-nitrogen family hydrolase [Prosthecobacter sp.]|nr:carbon-nitrogen family hydrolase [Prosthecobacter sp.]
MTLPIHAIQLDSVWEDKAASFAKVRALLAASPPPQGALVVLPEMFATGFSCAVEATAEPEHGETEFFLKALARDHRCCVVGGLVVRQAQGARALNQALAVGPDGEILARYTKRRPFSLGGESAVHERGHAPVVFEWGGFRLGLLVCYDLRFPELARDLVRLGAEVIVCIAAWPVKRFLHWMTLLQARAIENQAYVIGVNRTGSEPAYSYNGRSLVVDPQGVIIADAGEREQVLCSTLEHAIVSEWRAQFPALRDAALA